jgi:ribosomal protein S18 acetylase RimI-like enzyme
MHIRIAIPDDAKVIARVHVESEKAAYCGIIPDDVLASLSVEEQEVRWHERIARGSSSTLIAEQDGHALGWINFGKSRDLDAGPSTAEIRAMYVAPNSWRGGVGAALWRNAKDSLQQSRYSEVTLWVLKPNDLARNFYEKVGFCLETGIQKTLQRGAKVVPAVRYRLTLAAS